MVVGSTRPGILDEAWAIRLDQTGAPVWEETFSSGDHTLKAVTPATGGFIATGYKIEPNQTQKDLWVLRLDSNGVVIDSKAYSGPYLYDDVGHDILQVGEQFVVVGATQSFSPFDWDMWVLVLNDDLTVAAHAVIGGTLDDLAYGVAADPATGNLVVVGETWSYGQGNNDMYVLRTTSSLTNVWEFTFGGLWYEAAYAVTCLDGDVIVAGRESSYLGVPSDQNIWVLRLGGTGGGVVWEQMYRDPLAGTALDRAVDVTISQSGRILVAGDTSGVRSKSGYQMLLLNLDPATGTLAGGGWSKWYDGDPVGRRNDTAGSVVQSPDGTIFLTGVSTVQATGFDDWWVLKLQSDGDCRTGGPWLYCEFDDAYMTPFATDHVQEPPLIEWVTGPMITMDEPVATHPTALQPTTLCP